MAAESDNKSIGKVHFELKGDRVDGYEINVKGNGYDLSFALFAVFERNPELYNTISKPVLTFASYKS